MKFIVKTTLILGFLVFSKISYAQEFSSKEKLSTDLDKVEVIFKEIKDVKTAELIISSLKEIEGVKEVEIFYPHKTHAFLWIHPSVQTKTILDKLKVINIELEPKSLKK